MTNQYEVLIVDGNNVLQYNAPNGGRTKNLAMVLQICQDQGITPLVLVSARTRHTIDQPDVLIKLVHDGLVFETPAGVDSDLYILETADKLEAPILSNDLFREYRTRYPQIFRYRIPFMIVWGNVIIPTLTN